jgi:uncharacterized membrane protein
MIMKKNEKQHWIFTVVVLAVTVAALFIPTRFDTGHEMAAGTVAVKCRILTVDNTGLEQYGITKVGNQTVTVRVLSGKYRGTELPGFNQLVGKMELDTVYKSGMTALCNLYADAQGKAKSVTLQGAYRLNYELLLFGLFALFLVVFAGGTGVKALATFVFSGVMIWKIMLPLFLKGVNPVAAAVIIVMLLSAVILFIIGGFTEKGAASFLGTAAGVLVTFLLSAVFTHLFRLSGAVKSWMETLLYTGYSHLNLTQIFIAGIFIGASGAVMDISMDVASSIEEVYRHNPSLGRKELMLSGFRVGRSVIGTMTTTLLLAYSSSYMGLLMVFMAQGTSLLQILNLNYVAAELLNTIVGSFGLVLTAPLTAVVAAFLYTGIRKK